MHTKNVLPSKKLINPYIFHLKRDYIVQPIIDGTKIQFPNISLYIYYCAGNWKLPRFILIDHEILSKNAKYNWSKFLYKLFYLKCIYVCGWFFIIFVVLRAVKDFPETGLIIMAIDGDHIENLVLRRTVLQRIT